MKPYIIALALAFVLQSSFAQAPRIRTSAPPEKTAQPKGKTASEATQQTAPKPQTAPKGAKGKDSKSKKAAGDNSGLFMAVKTNIAYDVFAVLNAEFEMQVSRHFTIDVPVVWSLWDWKSDMGLRIVGVQPEARYWFGKPGKGNALGVNLGVASYNFRHNEIRYQNSGRPLLSAALSYTYALSIDNRWSAEFSLAVGYANAKYNRYYNIDNGAFINTKTLNYFGPTKIGISLSYRLGK